jgi:signal transduction histidine kinase
MLLIVVVTYYLAYVKNQIIAKTYLFIWTTMSLGGFVLVLVYLNLIELNFHVDYIIQFIVLIEVLFFAFVLAYKVKVIEKEKKSQEVILDKQNKFVAMGEMISTIAHQWRQPLSEINGVVLNMDLDYHRKKLSSKKFNAYMKEMSDVHAYLDSTVNDFINFFNHDKEVTSFFIMDVINHMKRLILISRKENVRFSLSVENIEIEGYQSELVQALLIVINNAIDAGVIMNQQVLVFINIQKIDKENLLIRIEDNAGGISPEILKKIFNPYFTTKHEFKGTGLGLYILKMIIEESIKGKVTIYNKNLGAMCEITVPIKVNTHDIK